MKCMLVIVAVAACTTEDLDIFAYGLSQTAYELDAHMNAPRPAGMYRQHVSDLLATSYPQYG